MLRTTMFTIIAANEQAMQGIQFQALIAVSVGPSLSNQRSATSQSDARLRARQECRATFDSLPTVHDGAGAGALPGFIVMPAHMRGNQTPRNTHTTKAMTRTVQALSRQCFMRFFLAAAISCRSLCRSCCCASLASLVAQWARFCLSLFTDPLSNASMSEAVRPGGNSPC